MHSIAFTNRKGGVGKSSCVLHLGIRFAEMGYRTLLVDADPQASLSQSLLGREALEIAPSRTMAGLFAAGHDLVPIDGVGGRDGLALIPGHEALFEHNTPRPWDSGSDQFILRTALADSAGDFDLCLLDCPPHIQACGWASLVAADGVVVPVTPEDLGIMGVSSILDTIARVMATVNPRLRLLGVLTTLVDRRLSIHTAYRGDLAAALGEDLFEASIPAAADFKSSITLRRGITEHRPKSAGAAALVEVADEILARLEARCGASLGQGVGR